MSKNNIYVLMWAKTHKKLGINNCSFDLECFIFTFDSEKICFNLYLNILYFCEIQNEFFRTIFS